jgi:D-glycero-D-manno-heptose 1,7-bisphosphate phosphatase
MEMKQKVVFIDRDGVINKDSPAYIKSWSEFEFLPRSLDAIQILASNGFNVIVITNQSAIRRNYLSKDDLEAIHSKMKVIVKQHGGDIKDIFYCPHIPEDQCDCRKPKPGLIDQAQRKYNIDISKTIMIGDSAKDIECAKNAGCGRSILVQTGNGIMAEKSLSEKGMPPDDVVSDLFEAASLITDREK